MQKDKKNYKKPEIKLHGNIKKITKGGDTGAGDGVGGYEPPHSGES